MADLIAGVFGARGCGKSLYLRELIRRERPRRLLLWDTMREHRDLAATEQLGELVERTRAPSWRLAFHPDMDPRRRAAQFELWCDLAYTRGECLVVVEELAFVTAPGRAPAAWRKLCLLGRHRAVRIVGTSQRPASVDKDFLGQCTLLHTGRLGSLSDLQTMADLLMIPRDRLAALRPLEWLERDADRGEVTAGKVRLPRSH